MATSGAVAQMGMRQPYRKKDTRCVANILVPKKNTLRYSFLARGTSFAFHTSTMA